MSRFRAQGVAIIASLTFGGAGIGYAIESPKYNDDFAACKLELGQKAIEACEEEVDIDRLDSIAPFIVVGAASGLILAAYFRDSPPNSPTE